MAVHEGQRDMAAHEGQRDMAVHEGQRDVSEEYRSNSFKMFKIDNFKVPLHDILI